MNPDDIRFSDSWVLATGSAQLPEGMRLSGPKQSFTCSLLLDRSDDRVIDASFSFLAGISEQYLAAMVVGRRLPHEWNELEQDVREHIFAPAQAVILQALRIAVDRYRVSSRDEVVQRKQDEKKKKNAGYLRGKHPSQDLSRWSR